MKRNFFTFGGLQLWGDVFLHGNWRIQFNTITHKYRLLDNYNIRRHEGNFDSCIKAFVRCKDIYKIPKSKPHLVVMIHGLAGTSLKFSKLRTFFSKHKIHSEVVNYPSTRQELIKNIKQIETALNSLDDVKEMSFVAHGVGGLIVRELLNSDAPWRKNIKVRRIVQINSPNRESRLCTKVRSFYIVKKIFGPTLEKLDNQNINRIASFPQDVEFGILCTHNPIIDALIKIMPQKIQKLMFNKTDSFLLGAKDALNIRIWGINSCNSSKTAVACLQFLTKGHFGK